MDTSSFIAPARISVLLVPIHPIKRAKFVQYANLIRGFGRIDLSDVPPDTRGERAIFSSGPNTPGALLFEYLTPTTYASSHPLAFLSEFQLHRRIHGIIGILDSSEYTDQPLSNALSGFHRSLKDLPKTFATKVYGFDPTEKQLDEGRRMKEIEGLVMVPGTGDIAFYLHTVLADFASEVLWEFSNMAAQLESRSAIATPQETPGLSSPFAFTAHKPNANSTLAQYTSPTSPVSPTSQQPVNLAHLGIAPPPQSRTALGMWGGSQSGNQDGFLYGKSIQSNMALHPGATPSPPLGAALVDQRARKKVAGREKKLMGDMWLLAGRLNEAIASYNEAIALTKAWHDQVWQASALEGLAVALVIKAWSPPIPHRNSQHRPQSPASHSATPPPPPPPPDSSTFLSSIPDRLSQAVSLYEKMLPTLNPSPDQPPPDPDRAHPLVYAEACLRCARFLLAVWEANGSIDKALERLVQPPPNWSEESKTSEEEARAARLRSLAPSNTVPRSSIASWVSLAYSPHLSALLLPTRLRVTGEIASIFGRIGYRRKESFVLRELAALCGEGVAGKGIEVFSTVHPSPHPPTIKEEGDESAAATPPAPNGRPSLRINPPSSDGAPSIVRTTSDSAGNDSIIRIAEKVCEAFGIVVVPKVTTRMLKEERRRSLLQGRPVEIMESERDRFGWSGLQVGVLRDAISIAEALPDYQAAIRFTVTALRTLSDTITPADQYELSQNIPRIFAAATRRGAAFELEYWGPTQLVMSLEMAPLSPNRYPFEHPYQEVELNAKSTTSAIAQRDPFIYSPKRAGVAAKVRPTLVQNETAEIFLTLQNPFLFELEIQSIELSTAGVPFASEPLSTVVPPGSFHTVRIRGTPLEAGLLIVRGCYIRLAGCTSREFLLPVWDNEEEAKRQKATMLDTSTERTKASGLGAFGREIPGESGGEEGLKFLECTVVPEMPLLWMRSTSLTHGALMLYDGEVSTIRIALENTSTSPVDFVKLTFSDMHTTSTEAYVAENELSAGDAYEIESENLHRPVFRWSSTTAPLIAPGASTVLEVQCLGKVGCGSGTIQLDYGFTDRPVVKSSSIFHTRQLFCDIFMTVHRALVAHSLDILRLKALPEAATAHGRSASVANLGRRGAALDQKLEESLKDVDDGEHCLVAVDVMNAYGKPFEVKVERSDEANDFHQIRQRIEPGATLRMLLRVDRIVIPAEQLAKPIPSLASRQFVVAKVKQSEEDERLARELFWYREELLQRIQATWNEVGSLRLGSISLRGLQLTKPMLDVLRGDDVDIQLHLGENPSAEPGAFQLQGRGQRLVYSATANEFIDICATIDNNSATALALTLRLELRPPDSSRFTTPAALSHLARYVVIEGVSPVSVPVLEPGASQTVRVSICLLAEGQYELGCVVEEREGIAGRERRSYGAREPLVIDVGR